jgi:hypothetical protein
LLGAQGREIAGSRGRSANRIIQFDKKNIRCKSVKLHFLSKERENEHSGRTGLRRRRISVVN